VTLAQAYFASQNASIVQPGVQAPAIDALVAGPVLV
jgi:hypothetical protein